MKGLFQKLTATAELSAELSEEFVSTLQEGKKIMMNERRQSETLLSLAPRPPAKVTNVASPSVVTRVEITSVFAGPSEPCREGTGVRQKKGSDIEQMTTTGDKDKKRRGKGRENATRPDTRP